MSSQQGIPQYALNGGVFQNGYQLQHYRFAGNDRFDSSQRLSHTIATAPEHEFQAMVNRARQMQALSGYLHNNRNRDMLDMFGIPQGPDPFELLATGDRAYILASLEHTRQEQAAAMERMDPGGRRAERELELIDRRSVEAKRSRREKGQNARCIIM